MSGTLQAQVLTPPGKGAIAVVCITGTAAWPLIRQHVSTASGKPLPESPGLYRTWYGRFAEGDDIILAVQALEPTPTFELHTHGGKQVVAWILEILRQHGTTVVSEDATSPWYWLARARTLRTAAILLDQCQGAFERVRQDIVQSLRDNHPGVALLRLQDLARFASLGAHLTIPWRVVLFGAPNVGKSSLINALAGYQRSIVSPIPGTTRDVVTVQLAFDGWPVELADTAGLREQAESLEAMGIELSHAAQAQADLAIHVLDGSNPQQTPPCDAPGTTAIVVYNKADLVPEAQRRESPDSLWVSAQTGEGLPLLMARIIRHLLPVVPEPGAAVPFSPDWARRIVSARAACGTGNFAEAVGLLESDVI